MWGEGVYLGVSHASHLKRVEFQGSPIFEVLLYVCIHPSTQNDQIRHGNTCEEGGAFSRGQPRH